MVITFLITRHDSSDVERLHGVSERFMLTWKLKEKCERCITHSYTTTCRISQRNCVIWIGIHVMRRTKCGNRAGIVAGITSLFVPGSSFSTATFGFRDFGMVGEDFSTQLIWHSMFFCTGPRYGRSMSWN